MSFSGDIIHIHSNTLAIIAYTAYISQYTRERCARRNIPDVRSIGLNVQPYRCVIVPSQRQARICFSCILCQYMDTLSIVSYYWWSNYIDVPTHWRSNYVDVPLYRWSNLYWCSDVMMIQHMIEVPMCWWSNYVDVPMVDTVSPVIIIV